MLTFSELYIRQRSQSVDKTQSQEIFRITALTWGFPILGNTQISIHHHKNHNSITIKSQYMIVK